MDLEEELEAQLKEALRVDVPPELKLSLRERIMNEARLSQHARQNVTASRRRWRLPFSLDMVRLHPLAFAGVFFLSAFAGTAAASSTAGPDSLLYPVRQRIEDTHVSLTRSNTDRARVELGLADQRLTEASDMLRDGKQEYVPDLLARYETYMSQAASLRDKAALQGRDVSEIDAMIAATSARSNEIMAAAAQSGALDNGSAGLEGSASIGGVAAVGTQAGNSAGGAGNKADAAQTTAPGAGAAEKQNAPYADGGMGAEGMGSDGTDLADASDEGQDSGGKSHAANRSPGSASVAEAGNKSPSANQNHGASARHGMSQRQGNSPVNAHH